MIAGWHLTRLGMIIAQWRYLAELPKVPWLYLSLTGLIWAGFGGPLFWGLWRGHRWVVGFAPRFVILYVIYTWLDRLFVAKESITAQNWPWPVAASFLLLTLTLWATLPKKNREFFAGHAVRNG